MARSLRVARTPGPTPSLYPPSCRLRKGKTQRGAVSVAGMFRPSVAARLPVPGSSAVRALAPRAQKLLDRPEDGVAVGDLADDDVFLLLGQLRHIVEELATAVGALHLSVPEQI